MPSFSGLLRLLAFLVSLVSASPSEAQQVQCGNTAATASTITAYNDFQDGVLCTTGGNAGGYTVESCGVILGAAAGNIRCAVYDGIADPKSLLCQSASQAVNDVALNTLSLTAASCGNLAPNYPYWVTFNLDNAATAYAKIDGTNNACTGAANSSFFVASTFGAAPNPWGTRTGEACQHSMRLTLTPVGQTRSLMGVGR